VGGSGIGHGTGGDGEAGEGQGGAGGTIIPGTGGTVPGKGGSAGTAGSAGSAGSGATGGDTCGGKPCADHKGSKDFTTDGTPSDAGDTFGKGTPHDPGSDTAREPAIIYPSHETMFPINVSRIRHDWSPGGTNALFQLRFEGPNTTVNVYTSEPSWLPDEEEWDWIAESNRGDAVELTVSGLDPTDPGDIWQSEAITLHFSDAEVEGAIYYWSTGTKGIMRALVSDPIPIKFYTDPAADDAGTCVACHTLSRDGKRLSVGYGGETLREVSVPDRDVLVPEDGGKGMKSAWTTFSPDGEMLLVAANGVLTLIDSDTGAPLGDDNGVVPIPNGTVATHPDWAALGDRVAITLGTKGGNKDVQGGSIAVLPYNDGAWGEPEILVSSSGQTDNNFFPVWSPDSRFIAYVNAPGTSKDAVGATLRLVPAAGRRSNRDDSFERTREQRRRRARDRQFDAHVGAVDTPGHLLARVLEPPRLLRRATPRRKGRSDLDRGDRSRPRRPWLLRVLGAVSERRPRQPPRVLDARRRRHSVRLLRRVW
jgi:hypothetical protein